MSEEIKDGAADTGELTNEQQEGIFAAASTAAAKDEAPPKEKVEKAEKAPAEKPEKKEAVVEAPVVKDDGAAAAAAAAAAAKEKETESARLVEQDKAEAAKKVESDKTRKSIIDEAAESMANQEFADPASGEGAKIKSSDLEKEYPSVTGYTRAVVAKALELQATQLRQEFDQKLTQALQRDPTITRMRQAEVEDQVATLLDSVSQGDDGIANAAEIQKAALSGDWLRTQPDFIKRMALESSDPRDVRFVLERAAADLKIEVKRGEGETTTLPKPASDNRVVAARSALRGTGRQAPPKSGMLTDDDANAEFERTAKALREGKPINE